MRNIRESKIKKSKAKKQKINRTKLNKPSFKPDVIEEDFCTLFSKEWTKNAAKITGLIKRERKIEAIVILTVLVFIFSPICIVLLRMFLNYLSRFWGAVHSGYYYYSL